MNAAYMKGLIAANAAEIERLRARISETYEAKRADPGKTEQWAKACAEFHARYDGLAFPGGYESAKARIAAGEPGAIEAALSFLELRPYFFRSGYMYTKLIRMLNSARLPPKQAARFAAFKARHEDWKRSRST